MFTQNDRCLKLIKGLVNFIVGFFIACGIIAFIVILIEGEIGISFIVLISSLLVSFLVRLCGNIVISVMCDIKLIRNKLYDVSNDDLKDFIE